MRINLILLTFVFNFLVFPEINYAQTTALINGTVIDVSNFGESHNDIKESVVLMRGDKLIHVGTKNSIHIPSDVKVMDIKGKYILPGLIDGFGIVLNQSYANAYLYLGVTSIIGIKDLLMGRSMRNAKPSPFIYKWGMLARGRIRILEDDQLIAILEKVKRRDFKILQLMYRLTPEQVKLAVDFCRKNKIATIGELGHAPYKDAITYGIDAVVHTQRYLLDVAPKSLKAMVANAPFGPHMSQYNDWLIDLDLNGVVFRNYAQFFGESKVGLMPTLSLFGVRLA